MKSSIFPFRRYFYDLGNGILKFNHFPEQQSFKGMVAIFYTFTVEAIKK